MHAPNPTIHETANVHRITLVGLLVPRWQLIVRGGTLARVPALSSDEVDKDLHVEPRCMTTVTVLITFLLD